MNTVFSHNGILYDVREISFWNFQTKECRCYMLRSEHGEEVEIEVLSLSSVREAIEKIERKEVLESLELANDKEDVEEK